MPFEIQVRSLADGYINKPAPIRVGLPHHVDLVIYLWSDLHNHLIWHDNQAKLAASGALEAHFRRENTRSKDLWRNVFDNMILHCSQKLAAKLHGVSPMPLEETSPLGSWHGHLYSLDRRQCVMFCHDATRYVLFMPGWRKAEFAELGERWFRSLFRATLVFCGCPELQIKKVEFALGPVRYDTATDRSVQGSLRIAQQDLAALLCGVPDVMDLDPVAVSRHLNERPATVYGKLVWPDKAMLEIVA